MEDNTVLKQIEKLSEEEENLYTKGNLTQEEIQRLHKMNVELDRCWDLLRQRRALRDAGRNPDQAQERPAIIVENYKH